MIARPGQSVRIARHIEINKIDFKDFPMQLQRRASHFEIKRRTAYPLWYMDGQGHGSRMQSYAPELYSLLKPPHNFPRVTQQRPCQASICILDLATIPCIYVMALYHDPQGPED